MLLCHHLKISVRNMKAGVIVSLTVRLLVKSVQTAHFAFLYLCNLVFFCFFIVMYLNVEILFVNSAKNNKL